MQCLPTGRGTTVVTSDHDGVAIAAGDATAVVAAAGLNLEAKEPELQCLPTGMRDALLRGAVAIRERLAGAGPPSRRSDVAPRQL